MGQSVPCQPLATSWARPCSGMVKINCDAHLGVTTGLGVVIRDEEGMILVAAMCKEYAGWAPEVAEAAACRYGLQLAARLGYTSVILESDAAKVVNGVKKMAGNLTPFSVLVDDICALSHCFVAFSISHVKRAGNTLAYNVARWDSSGCIERVCLGPFPQSLLSSAEIDLY
ncbi:uncharacterized protein LOC110729946 [Chenopodium quinoa]|uniref:uncharacterized protein LOC110729946 n=1 Tax=Chenopodium quinoa TaxID=63459 RepID=UPI000B785F20|nr:uncharacterized protein LOC110729946 [Chenopodium quinoa]